ncbi:MAG: PfkB family carbohydrate kinase [Rubrobacteraceae bacterium]
MHVAFINPQGNFDPADSYWTAHPDFGGQLVYVKQLALAMGNLGHRVDIVTRRIIDPDWPEFASPTDAYKGNPNVRILRVPFGPEGFLPKEELWPYLATEFVPRLLDLYEEEGSLPDVVTAHYGDGGLCAAVIEERTGIPFSFTAHSLGAQKMDKMGLGRGAIADADAEYHFSRRLVAERLSMNHSVVNVTSTSQERYSQYTHNAYRGAVDPTDDARFAAVPPGVAMHIFDKSSRHEEEEEVHEQVRSALARDLRPERLDLPCIVASSRLDPKKNHQALVEAFAASPSLREAANLVIVTGDLEDPLNDYRDARPGERTVLDALMRTIDREGLRREVSMFALRGQGALAAGYRYFAGLRSVFALTAQYEPFGLAPLEAIAAGLPAVVTKFGGPSESLRSSEGEYGILVDPNDRTEVGAGLFSLVGNRKRWQRYSEAGYERVLSRYTWERTAEGYLAAISGSGRVVDEIERETRASAGTSDHRAEEDSANGSASPATVSDAGSGRLPIPRYFLDPGPNSDFTPEELDELYFRFEVLAVGETLVDFISHERVRSLRTARQFNRYLGGEPANVAVYVAKLGARSVILSKVGEEYFGEFLEEQLQRHGVGTEALRHTDAISSTGAFVTQAIGVPDFQVNRGADALLDPKDVPEELIERSKAVHTSAFALSREPQRSAVRRALRLANKYGKLVSLDPNYDPRVWLDRDEAWEVIAQILPNVTIVKPSLEDARRLFDPNLEDEALEEACLEEFHNLGADVVVVTRSGERQVTVSDGSKVERVGPLHDVEVENVTGGGDAFWSALLVARLDGKDWPETIRFAHEVAALKLRVMGHVERMIDRREIYACVQSTTTQEV